MFFPFFNTNLSKTKNEIKQSHPMSSNKIVPICLDFLLTKFYIILLGYLGWSYLTSFLPGDN